METLTKVSEQEYLLLESQATFKSEYHAGEIVAMAGTQEDHNLIVTNLIFALTLCLRGKYCRVYHSDILVKLEECEKYVYPDLMVICGKTEKEKRNGIDVFLNPSIIVEVLSESTANYDKNDKLDCYLTLESLKEYWLFDSLKMKIVSYKRSLDNYDDWVRHISDNINETIKIGECEISLKDIYTEVTFDSKN